MGAHQNFVQRTVVFGVAVIGAGLDGAFDALVCIAVHMLFLLLFGTPLVWPQSAKGIMETNSFLLIFNSLHDMMQYMENTKGDANHGKNCPFYFVR